MTTPPLLRPDLFTGLPGVAAGFSTRHGGVSTAPFDSLNLGLSTGDAREQVLENRRRLCAALGFAPDHLAIAGQVHGDRIKIVTEPGLFPGYDALVTRVPGILLCISAADCAAVLLADPEARVVGACHSGWRGTVARIAPQTVEAMTAHGAERHRIRAYISPCIGAEHFEVGPEVAARFDAAYVRRYPDREKPYVDLKAAIAAQLREAGLADAAVEVAPHCTYAGTDDFFSYRAENGETGRMMGCIGLTPTAS